MADTLKRMVGPKQLASSTTVEYTSPATGAVVRHIILSNPGTTDRTVTIGIGADAAGTRIWDAYTIPAGTVFSWPVNIVLGNAEDFRMHCSAATAVVATVSGVET